MEGIYEVSSSEKVRSLEEDLKKELKELQNEVEEGNFLSSSAAPSSETQGQIVGTRESLNGRKNMARRKVKNGEKSPWGQSLTRLVPNGRRRSGF